MTEKCSVVYSNDFRLDFVVVNQMPKLQAKFFDFPTNLLCGEVKLVNVQFSNVGVCPLHRILVASPTPEHFVFGSCGGEDADLYSHFGYAIRSNGVTNSLHCSSPVIVEWKKGNRVTELLCADGSPVRLEPGGSFVVPFWIRGPDAPGTQHNLDLMFYYETPQTPTKLKYRLLQHTFVFSTSPSLRLSASAKRSFLPNLELGTQTNSLVVSVDVHNAIKTPNPVNQDISIIQVNGASQNWCISSFQGTSINSAIHLKPSESLLMNFHVLPFTTKNTVASQEVMVFSQVPLERMAVDSSLSPCSDFCVRSLLSLRPFLGEPEMIQQGETAKPDQTLKILEASNTVNLTLTVLWKATVQRFDKFFVVIGQHHVTVEQLTCYTPQPPALLSLLHPQATDENFKQSLAQKILKCILQHSVNISHNFKHNRLAVVPVKLILSNCCNTEVTVIVDLGKNVENTPASESCQYKWLGVTRHITILQPLGSNSLSLCASFSHPGTYNLASVRVTARLSLPNSETVNQEPLAPSLLIINDSP